MTATTYKAGQKVWFHETGAAWREAMITCNPGKNAAAPPSVGDHFVYIPYSDRRSRTSFAWLREFSPRDPAEDGSDKPED